MIDTGNRLKLFGYVIQIQIAPYYISAIVRRPTGLMDKLMGRPVHLMSVPFAFLFGCVRPDGFFTTSWRFEIGLAFFKKRVCEGEKILDIYVSIPWLPEESRRDRLGRGFTSCQDQDYLEPKDIPY